MTTLNIKSLEAQVYRVPVETPVRASFGTMRDRPAVVIRAEDFDGMFEFPQTPGLGIEPNLTDLAQYRTL